MLKKILVFLLCLAVICVMPATVFAQTQDSSPNEIDSVTITEDGYMIYPADPGYAEEYLGVPDKVAAGSTEELLAYFLQTDFIFQRIYLRADTNQPADFSEHKAYQELVSRKDLPDVLESHAKSIIQGTDSSILSKVKFEQLLKQPEIQSISGALSGKANDYPNLIRYYNDAVIDQTRASGSTRAASDIQYNRVGSIRTANNNAVSVYQPTREMTAAEISEANTLLAMSGNTRIAEPTAYYNCHSYAWYLYSSDNPYWIVEIDNFLDDDACSQVTTIQEKDIIVYYNKDKEPKHSGVVYSVSSSGTPTIQSKWGMGGVYRHAVSNVPSDYKANGQVSVKYFRYHDYTNKYTGNNYHSGTRHYYQYADFCDICNKQINTTWTSVVCNGPPCNTIMSLTPVPQIA